MIPSTLRAVLLGAAILIGGGGVSGGLMVVNLSLAPTLPLFLPATLLWLWLLWSWAGGAGWPRSTSAARRDLLRAPRLSGRVWTWALVAGGIASVAVMGIAFVTYHFAILPEAAHRPPFEVSRFPVGTQIAIFAAVALTAGVVEEAAFRGYMLSGLERRYGWPVGIAIVSILFYFAHLSHAYVTLAFLPFFLAHGLLTGLTVFYTRSIVPGIVLHTVTDCILLPMQYRVIPSAGEWPFVWQGWMSLLAGILAIPAFQRLARETAPLRASAPSPVEIAP